MILHEYIKFALLPKELRYKNLLYHSTIFDSFEEIIKTNVLYGTHGYDFGVATSRNKHYGFGNHDDIMHNMGDIQFILDKEKIQHKYKTQAFDWEEWKSVKSTVGKYNDYHQSEDKILSNQILNIKKFIIGIHIINNDLLDDTMEILKKYNFTPKYIFDENWNIVKIDFNI